MKNATRTTVSTFGVIIGIAGLEHGVGEIFQGNIAPNSVVIESWPNNPAYEILAGEPAMTIIPNLLLTGILTVIVSIIFMIWAAIYVERKNGVRILMLLTLVLLLVGGGFAPPIISALLIYPAIRINSPPKRLLSIGFLGKFWPIIFVISIISYFSLWPGMVILYYLNPTGVYPMGELTLLAFGTLILSLLSSLSYDSLRKASISTQL